jgi:cell division protein FtsL
MESRQEVISIKILLKNAIKPFKLINAILVLVLSIIYIFAPFKSNQYTYEWNPKVDGNSSRLTLLELNPKEFDIHLPCIAIEQQKKWIFEALGGPAFLFEADANYFYFTTGIPQSNSLVLNKFPRTNLSENCSTVLKFDDEFNGIKITNGNVTKSYTLIRDTKFFFSSHVNWNESLENEDFLLKVKTKSLVGTEKTLLKTIVFFLIAFILLLYFQTSLIRFLSIIHKFRIKVEWYDLSAFIVIILSIFTVSPMADDGIYLINARILETVGDLIQFSYPVTFPTGHIHAWINGISSTFNLGFFYARIIPGLILYLNWKLISLISVNFQSSTHKSKIMLFSFWSLFVFSFGITLRPEPYISLIFLGLIYFLIKSNPDRLSDSISYSIIGTSLALAIHQSGFVILFASIPVWIIGFNRRSSFIYDFEKIYYSLVIAVLIFFQNSSLFLFFKRYQNFERVNSWPQAFTGDFRWGYPPYLEYMRIIHLKLATPSQILLVTLTLFVFLTLLISYSYVKKSSIVQDLNIYMIYLSILSAPFGLILAPSKWAGHYAAIFPVLIIGYFIIRKFSNKFVLFHCILILISIFSLTLPWKNGGSDTLNIYFNFRTRYFESYLDYTLLIFFSALFVFVLYLVVSSFIKSPSVKYTYTLSAFVIVLNPFMQNLPNLVDSLNRDQSWTFSRQIFREILKEDGECGMFNTVEVLKIPIDFETGTFVFNQGNYAYFSCLNPILPEMGVWRYPKYSVGGIPIWDQQRLANKSNIEKVHCPTFKSRSFEDENDRCIYKWTSLIPEMRLVSSEKVYVY